jgi:hypothetical protein
VVRGADLATCDVCLFDYCTAHASRSAHECADLRDVDTSSGE